MKLHQVVAILTGKKTKVQNGLTRLLRRVEGKASFEGHAREYRPVNDDGEQFPPDRKNIPLTVQTVLDDSKKLWTDLLNLVATLDHGNSSASGTVRVDGVALFYSMPVPTLIFLERRLEDMRSLYGALPVLPPEKNWTWSDDVGCFISDVEQVRKTEKVRKAQVLYEATTAHPAQVEPYTVDETIGWWHTKHQSGAIPATQKEMMLNRIDALIDALKAAREEANEQYATEKSIASVVFDYVIKGAKPEPPKAAE